MATFYGYVILVVGLSILLALAGVDTTTGKLTETFIDITPTSPTGNYTIDATHLNKFEDPWLIAFFAIIAGFVVYGAIKLAIGGSSDMAATLKVGGLSVFLVLMLADFVSILTYLNGITEMSGVIKIVASVVYIPIAIGAIIAGIDWVGGGK